MTLSEERRGAALQYFPWRGSPRRGSQRRGSQRRGWRVAAVAGSAAGLCGILALPAPASGAQARAGHPASAATAGASAGFYSSLEATDPQPAWTSTAETDSQGNPRASGVTAPSGDGPMTTAVGSGPATAYTARTNVGFSGVRSLEYAGHQASAGRGYSYNKVFSVDIPVGATTQLSYKIFPALMNPDLGQGLPSPSTYASVDLAFSDGTYLSDLGARDQHGFALTAQGQGNSKTLYANQWNAVSSRIGEVAAGKTITRILVDYDKPSGPADFRGWIDDIDIANRPVEQHAHLSDWVDTRRGSNSNITFSRGTGFPAAAVPHGFNFWTPLTDASESPLAAGSLLGVFYRYQQDNNAENFPTLQAFGLSHEPSPWIGDRDTFQVMPSAGAGNPDPDRSARALPFTHDNEVAKPYYYGVTFNNGMRTEIAPTDHAAIFRFTFTGNTSNLIFDNVNNDGGLTLDPSTGTLTGYTDTRSWPTAGATRMFVYATFDKPVVASGMLPESGRPNVTGYYQFDTSGQSDKVVTMRIATSLISLAQAKHNLEMEIPPGASFQSVKTHAQKLWDDALGVISNVRGASPDQLTSLYSSLYLLNLYPNSAYENTGTAEHPVYEHASPTAPAQGPDTPTQTGAAIRDGAMYVNNGFWDTYRTAWPTYSLLYPTQAGRMIDGFVNQYKEGGWIARWSAPGYTNSMVGTSSDAAFADAYLKGVSNFDVKAAYEAAVKNASVAPPNASVGRQGLDTSIFRGYTPTSTSEGMSWAMEGYINDFGIAQMSKALYERAKPGDPSRAEYQDNYGYFLNRAQNYVKMFDPSVGFFQGRNPDGSWRLSPQSYDPRVWGCDYTETDGWGMAFTVPQDGQGLADLYGGRKQLADKLDKFFSTPETADFPGCYGTAIVQMTSAANQQMGQWSPNNETSFHIPYMYDYAGQPYKAQAKIREALSRLYVGSEIGQGYPGDEDNGEMPAWYIMSAMGFYPLQVGSPYYVIGSPLFQSATLNLENGKKIVINAPGNSARNVYIQSLTINGKPYDKTYLSQADLAGGAVLDFQMGPAPSQWGTQPGDAPLSITNGNQAPQPLQDAAEPGQGSASASPSTDVAALFDDTSNTQVSFASPAPWVEYTFPSSRQVTYYTLTSGQNAGDPRSWVLEGSNDGTTWTVLDQRAGESFQWRQFTRAFKVAQPGNYTHYRIRVTQNSGGPTTSLAEVELLAAP